MVENIFVLFSKKCPHFDLCPYFCLIFESEVLIPGASIGENEEERDFSTCGKTLSQRRTLLSPDTVEAIELINFSVKK